MTKREVETTYEGTNPPGSWDRAMHRELVELYLDGMDIEMLGWHFQKKAREIYAELIALLLGVTELKENPLAPRFRKRWGSLEDSELVRLYRRNLPIEEIAEQLGRDVPGVAMRLINSWWVACPPEVAHELGLNEIR
jgi:hypothetical protein